MMPLAAGRFDCKMLYSSPGRSWYRKDLMYGWVIIIIIIKGYFLVVHLCYHDRTMNQCFLPMGQQGEGTARVTHEKVNLRDGLGIRQAPHSTWVWVIFWSWVVLLSLITEKNKTSPGTPCSRIKFECEQCLITALDHKRMPWPPHKWFGGNPGITALKAAFMDSLCLQGVFTIKPKQSGSLNHKAHVWSFHFVWIHALKPAVWGCPKVNLQTKHPSLGAAAVIQVQASTAFLCFSFYHVHFELLLPALNFSSHHWGFCLKQRKGRADFPDQKTPE